MQPATRALVYTVRSSDNISHLGWKQTNEQAHHAAIILVQEIWITPNMTNEQKADACILLVARGNPFLYRAPRSFPIARRTAGEEDRQACCMIQIPWVSCCLCCAPISHREYYDQDRFCPCSTHRLLQSLNPPFLALFSRVFPSPSPPENAEPPAPKLKPLLFGPRLPPPPCAPPAPALFED